MGSSVDVRSFVHDALLMHKVTVKPTPRGFQVETSDLPRAVADAMRIEGRVLKARFDVDVRDGETYLSRTHPMVSGLAPHVLDTALDTLGDGGAGRRGPAIPCLCITSRTGAHSPGSSHHTGSWSPAVDGSGTGPEASVGDDVRYFRRQIRDPLGA